MSKVVQPTELNQKSVDIDPHDLPLHCPTASVKLWSNHPRVFLSIEPTGEARCPYCGTLYKLIGGPRAGGH
jgi:uncharacterized Zn-finger protein